MGRLTIVLPWMENGTLLDYSREHPKFNVDQALFEVANGLAYLHSRKIIHGDLRGHNILMDDALHACLSDFGLTFFGDVTTEPTNGRGSVRWMAPELHEEDESKPLRRTTETDVYAFACVCLEIYTGSPPFSTKKSLFAVAAAVKAGSRPKWPLQPTNGRLISDYLWNAIIKHCWAHDPTERYGIAKVVELMKEHMLVISFSGEERNLRLGMPLRSPYPMLIQL